MKPRRYVSTDDGPINSLIPFQSKKPLLWRFNVAGNNETYKVIIKCGCLILTKFGFPRQIFIKVPNNKFHVHQSSGGHWTDLREICYGDTCGQTEGGRTDEQPDGRTDEPRKGRTEEQTDGQTWQR